MLVLNGVSTSNNGNFGNPRNMLPNINGTFFVEKQQGKNLFGMIKCGSNTGFCLNGLIIVSSTFA